MTIFLWIPQVLLALHTAIGAGWKIFNSEQTIPTLSAISHGVWMVLIPFELICAVGLAAPALSPSLGWLAALAAIGNAVEMLVFSGIQLWVGAGENGQVAYWLGVAAICAVIAVGRWIISPV